MNLPTEEITEAFEDILQKIDRSPPRVKREIVVHLIRRAFNAEAVLMGYRQWLTAETERLQAEINAAANEPETAAISAAVLQSRRRSLETLRRLSTQGGL